MAYQLISAFLLQPTAQHICSADTTTTTSSSNCGANEMDLKKCPHTAPGSFCFSSKPLCLHLYTQQGLWSRFAISGGCLRGSANTYLHRWAAGKTVDDVADWTLQCCGCQPGIFFVIASTYAQFCYTTEHCFFFFKKQCCWKAVKMGQEKLHSLFQKHEQKRDTTASGTRKQELQLSGLYRRGIMLYDSLEWLHR